MFIKQPSSFVNSSCPNSVYKISRAFDGLKHAQKAWYERLSTFLLQNNFQRRNIYQSLFIQKSGLYILIVQIYVDDIIFGNSNSSLCENFANLIKGYFEMSVMGELTFFLGLQINQFTNGNFIRQSKYTKELIKRFGLEKGKAFGTPMSPSTCLETDKPGKDVDKKMYWGMVCSLYILL